MRIIPFIKFPECKVVKSNHIFQINGEDVRQASHEQVVNHIRKSGDLVSLTVVTVLPQFLSPLMAGAAGGETASANASPSMSSNAAAVAASQNNSARQYSTLPRKLVHKPPAAGGVVQPPPPPKRNPNTTLSIGKARARSMVANLSAIGQ